VSKWPSKKKNGHRGQSTLETLAEVWEAELKAKENLEQIRHTFFLRWFKT
jgi:hypothetical protein